MRTLLALSVALLLLSVGPGATASTSTPPRNGLIAVNGTLGIYLIDPSTNAKTLVPRSAEMTDPAWSPDGTLLAVSVFAGGGSDIYTMKPDGSESTLVLEDAHEPAWSPDGKQLVVVREGTPDGDSVNSLAIVDSDGTDARVLQVAAAKRSQWLGGPEWSPDGKLIAFVAIDGDDRSTVEIVSPDGKAASTLEVEPNETSVSWSPDSGSLAFDRYVETNDFDGHSAAVVLDLATGRERVYAQLGAQSPTWSPEGDQLAFLSASEQTFVSHLWVMSPNGTKAHKLVEIDYYGAPSWGASEAAPTPRLRRSSDAW